SHRSRCLAAATRSSRDPTDTFAHRSQRSRRASTSVFACATGAPARWWRLSTPMAEPEVSLDKALERLEAIADKLEDPALDLDEAVRLYEEGLRLYAECAKRLDAADLRITQLADALAKQARERGAAS